MSLSGDENDIYEDQAMLREYGDDDHSEEEQDEPDLVQESDEDDENSDDNNSGKEKHARHQVIPNTDIKVPAEFKERALKLLNVCPVRETRLIICVTGTPAFC